MATRKKQTSEAAVREIRRKTRRRFAPEEKIRIVLDGLRGEQSISELCRREGIAANLYYRWSKDFLEAGKKIHFEKALVALRTNFPMCLLCTSSKLLGLETPFSKRQFLAATYAALLAR